MITQNELVQERVDFWKQYLLEESQRDLNMTIGLVKSMTANACRNNGEKDGTGLYHASILAGNRLEDFSTDILDELINLVIDRLVTDIYSLEDS